jgi:hypothetical protein
MMSGTGTGYTADNYFYGTVTNLAAATDLSSVFAYPNPANFAGGTTSITFTNLAENCTIRIFNARGELARTISVSGGSGETTWDGKTNFGGDTASGVYLYLVESSSDQKTGKLIILR